MTVQRDPHFAPAKLPVQPFLYYLTARQKAIIPVVLFALYIGVIDFLAVNPSAVRRLQNTLGRLSFLIDFGIEDGYIIGFIVYTVLLALLAFGAVYFDKRLLYLLYKRKSSS